MNMLDGKVILITGGTGSFGKKFLQISSSSLWMGAGLLASGGLLWLIGRDEIARAGRALALRGRSVS